jgi:integrase
MKATRRETARPHTVYLSPLALELLEPLLASPGSDWVFQSPRKGLGAISSVRTANERFRTDTGIADLGTHVLRKTGATILGNLGFPSEVVDACLGVAPAGVSKKHYNFAAYKAEKQEAFTALSEHVAALVSGEVPEGRVVPLRRPAS